MKYYYRTFSNGFIPEGYELVENDDHKKLRLEEELEGLENRIEALQRYLVIAEEKRKTVEEELKKLE